MPSIHKEITVAAGIDSVWAAFRDVGAVHRLAPGFVTDCKLEEGGASRIVTFGNGIVAREVIVDLDDAAHRLAYSASGGRLTHHNASFQLTEDGPGRCRIVWHADLLPAEMKPAVEGMMEQGMAAMKKRLSSEDGT